MKIVFLGTTGYHPNNRRHTASIMLPELGIIFDAGTGIFRSRNLLQTPDLNIFLSHVHLDHSFGLTFLFDIAFEKELNTTVFVEQEKIGVLETHLFHQLLFPAKLPMQFQAVESGVTATVTLPDSTEITTFPLNHPGGSLGFVLRKNGKSMAYVTDTTASLDEDYLEQLRGVDLLIHECYFPDGFEEKAALTGHSCATPVAEVARHCDVGELVLVHVNPLDESDDPVGLKSMREKFPRVHIAEDLEVIDL